MSGIFGLSAYNDQNLAGLIPDKTRESFREYGYFGGGFSNTTVNRVDYSNDTATASQRTGLSFLGGQRARHNGATGNSKFGYFAGGNTPSVYSVIFRIDYSNDLETPSIRGPLSLARSSLSATGNSNFGYFGGGVDPAVAYSTIDRIDYSSDLSTASVRGPLLTICDRRAAVGNPNFGYFNSGTTGTSTNVERISYSNDLVIATNRSGLLTSATEALSSSSSPYFGYFGGGWAARSVVHRISYANDTVAQSIRGPLSVGRGYPAGNGNSNFGYYAAGSSSPSLSGSMTSIVERIDYSNDTVSTSTRGSLTYSSTQISATSSHNFGGSPNSQYGVFPKPFGYFGGGFAPGSVSTVDRIDYSSDTSIARTRGSLSSTRRSLAATGNSNFGYFGGSSNFERIDYVNDFSTSVVRSPLSLSRNESAATGNSNFGYYGAGWSSPTNYSTVDRINYTNDTLLTSVRGSLTEAKRALSATGNINFGYFGGGFTSTTILTIDRIDYSNDTATASARALFNTARREFAATGNNNFGYFGGGVPGVSTVDRVDYSNDTANASPRGPLSLERYKLSATGNSNFGYFGGGVDAAVVSPTLTVDRIDYSNDTATASVRGPLSLTRSELAATSPLTPSSAFSPDQLIRGTSNTDFQPTSTFFDIQSMRRIEDTTNESVKKRVLGSYGYFGGGDTSFNVATTVIDRIDYSNDLISGHTRLFLNSARSHHGQVGNKNYGYLGFGRDPVNMSTVSRIDYSNDSARDNIRTPSPFKYTISCFGNDNFGYFSGGDNRLSSIDRINYSNDTSLQISRALHTINRAATAATTNSNFGWIGGGNAGSVFSATIRSTVERIDFSNDSSRLSIRGSLTNEVALLSATGNSNFGYFGGGAAINPKNYYGNNSVVLRIDYSNDTAITSIRGPLSLARRQLAATGNSNFGYFGGGSPVPTSRVDRINYSNDTATASPRGPLSAARYALAASTNARNS